MIASRPGSSNSRGIRTAWLRPFLKRRTWREEVGTGIITSGNQHMTMAYASASPVIISDFKWKFDGTGDSFRQREPTRCPDRASDTELGRSPEGVEFLSPSRPRQFDPSMQLALHRT